MIYRSAALVNGAVPAGIPPMQFAV